MGSNFSIFEIKSYFSWRGCEVAAIELVDQIIQVSSSQRGLKYPEVSALVVETKHPARNYSSNTQSLASNHLALYSAGPTFYFRKIVFHLSIRPPNRAAIQPVLTVLIQQQPKDKRRFCTQYHLFN